MGTTLTPEERMNLEFFARIAPDYAEWFCKRRNKAIFAPEREIKAFMGELNIPFPIKNNTLFWTIIYFARRLCFPNDGQALEHLKAWCGQCGAKCTSNRTDPTKPKLIEFGRYSYIMPVELWWTPTEIPKETFPDRGETGEYEDPEFVEPEDW